MESTHAFFSDWGHVARTALIGVLAYAALIVMLRVGGKRTLVKLNVFDFAGTVALGSALATTILSPDVSLAEGLVGIGAIVAAQSTLAWVLDHSSRLEAIVNGQPKLLVHRGRVIESALGEEHITIEEIRAAMRGQGIAALGDVEAMVLETDGTFSVIRADPSKTYWALGDVPGVEPEESRASDASRGAGEGRRRDEREESAQAAGAGKQHGHT